MNRNLVIGLNSINQIFYKSLCEWGRHSFLMAVAKQGLFLKNKTGTYAKKKLLTLFCILSRPVVLDNLQAVSITPL